MDRPKHGQKVSRAPQGSRQKESSSSTAFQQGRAATSTPKALSLAKDANSEIDKDIAFDPKDVSFHVLKSYALEQQGLLPGAIDSLNITLSDDMENVMIPSEMCDALLRRANLLLSSSKDRRNVDAAIPDLQKCLQIIPDNLKVACFLSLCIALIP
ncbi:hypothetical protein GOP47_0017093 [Adiantum capillus-veneris]|nr:hypothetical protein GOP47_0017093 [Adiantum capillus-veneris]